MKAQHYINLLIVAIIVNSVPRFIDFGTLDFVQEHYSIIGKKAYYTGQALSFFLILIAHLYKGQAKYAEMVYRIALWLAASNLIDELFFDPVHFGINEIVFAIVIIGMEFFITTKPTE